MRTIKRANKFKRDYKREKSGRHSKKIDVELKVILSVLISDTKLPARNVDHQLYGNWNDHRDCHIFPDLVLIYRKPDDETLELVRMGSHSELGI